MPIYLPNNLIQDTASFEGPPPTSRLGGAAVDIASTLASGPTYWALTKAATALAPGKFLTGDEYKTSPYARAGLDFPDGVGENVARLRAENFDANQVVQTELSNMPSGALSTISRFAGTAIGAALDPINLGSGIGVEATLGVRAPALLARLGEIEPIAQRAAQAGVGAVEGGLIATPQALSQYSSESDLGEDPSSLSVLANIGLGMGLGGIIRGIAGFKAPITVEADRLAKQTAVNQLMSGKSVRVDEILQDGNFQARNLETALSPEELQATKDRLSTSLGDTNRAIADENANLDRSIYKQQAADFFTPRDAIPTGKDTVDTLSAIFQKPEALRDASDLAYLNNLPKTEEVQNLVSALKKPGFLQDASDRIMLDTFNQNQEQSMLTKRLAEHGDQANELQTKIDATPKKNTKVLKDLNNQLEEVKGKIETGNQRLKVLDNLGKEPEPIRQSRERINQLMAQKSNLENELHKHDAIVNLTKDNAQPVTGNQVKNASDHMRDFRSDSTYNEAQQTALTDELKGMPDEPHLDLEREEAQIKRLEEQGLLDEEDRAMLDKARENERKLSVFEKAIKNAANCLKGFVS